MKKILEEAYRAEIKLDQNSVLGLCNSLNAWQNPLRVCGLEMAAFYMHQAQRMIAKLYDENQDLKHELKMIKENGGKSDGKV